MSRQFPFATPGDFIHDALFTTHEGITLSAGLDRIAAQRGGAVGVWHVITPYEQLVVGDEQTARAAAAAFLRSYRRHERLAYGTARAVRRTYPTPKLRDGASGRSYRSRAAGMHWDAGSGWVRLYQRTEEMERGRAAERSRA